MACLLAAPSAFAHDGAPPQPHDLWEPHNLGAAWPFDPLIVLPLLAALTLYTAGVLRVWRRAGAGRGVTAGQVAAFFGAALALAVALVSPLDPLSSALFSAHMTQHLLLILVAAPLLALARPLAAFAWGLPRGWSVRLARSPLAAAQLRRPLSRLALPAVAWTLHSAALWAWHLPGLYEWALRSDFAHALEHLAFFGTALLFWWAVMHRSAAGMGYGASVLLVFTMGLQSAALGALLTFSAAPWYPSYATTTQAWGLTPLADQQLAGAIMWAPAGLVYVGVAVGLLAAWLRGLDAREHLRPR